MDKGFRPIACPGRAAALRFVRHLAAIHRDDRVLYVAVCSRRLIDAALKCKPAAPLEREPPAVLLPRCRSKKKSGAPGLDRRFELLVAVDVTRPLGVVDLVKRCELIVEPFGQLRVARIRRFVGFVNQHKVDARIVRRFGAADSLIAEDDGLPWTAAAFDALVRRSRGELAEIGRAHV